MFSSNYKIPQAKSYAEVVKNSERSCENAGMVPDVNLDEDMVALNPSVQNWQKSGFLPKSVAQNRSLFTDKSRIEPLQRPLLNPNIQQLKDPNRNMVSYANWSKNSTNNAFTSSNFSQTDSWNFQVPAKIANKFASSSDAAYQRMKKAFECRPNELEALVEKRKKASEELKRLSERKVKQSKRDKAENPREISLINTSCKPRKISNIDSINSECRKPDICSLKLKNKIKSLCAKCLARDRRQRSNSLLIASLPLVVCPQNVCLPTAPVPMTTPQITKPTRNVTKRPIRKPPVLKSYLCPPPPANCSAPPMYPVRNLRTNTPQLVTSQLVTSPLVYRAPSCLVNPLVAKSEFLTFK